MAVRASETNNPTGGKVSPLDQFDQKTRETIEALVEDDEAVVPLRSLAVTNDDGGDNDDKDQDPAHAGKPADEQVQDEDTRVSSPAPWTPVPVRQARQFIKDHPEAAIDVVFPTVYEEDRSAKLKDLGTAQALGSISHRRMSEMMAKELGVDPYVYNEEMEQIEQENPPIDPAKKLGSGDQVVKNILGPLAGTPPKPQPGGGGFPSDTPDLGAGFPRGDTGGGGQADSGFAEPEDQGPRGKHLSAPVQAEFRKQQREIESLKESVTQLIEENRRLREVASQKQPVNVTVNPADVTVNPPAVHVEGTKVDVTVEGQKRVVKQVERDPDTGQIMRVIESSEGEKQ